MLIEEVHSIGVIVDKRKAQSPWIDHLWVPSAVVPGVPDAAPMTLVGRDGTDERYFVGSTHLVFASSETANYRDNLLSGAPKLWVVLRLDEATDEISLLTVTADPTEGEGSTQAGSNIVDTVPMPAELAATLAAFVDRHHVEREFYKRKRDKTDPNKQGFRGPRTEGGF
ncbi:Protein of unknown function DUF3305 [Rhabdaerophilaceae bacterium]